MKDLISFDTLEPVTKERKDVMKKILSYFLLGLGLFGMIQNTKAETEQFYRAEVVPNIFLALERPGKTYYQQGDVLRRKSDGQFSYCIAPFHLLKEDASYNSNITPENLSETVWNHINALAYFGYGYKEHTEMKWYFITQVMIWRTVDPERNFYFTDGFEGMRTEPFLEEEKQLEKLVDDYFKDPIWNDKDFTGVVDETITISDPTNTTHYYQYEKQEGNNILDNELQIKITTLGEKVISLKREENNYPLPPLVYYSSTSQEMMVVGKLKPKQAMLVVRGVETDVTIQKQDKETETSTPQGSALLEGTVFGIYQKESDTLVATITIGKDGIGKYKNLPFGSYYIKEINPGIGYHCNETIYPFSLHQENTSVFLSIKNEVIKQKVEIYKQKEDSTQQKSFEQGVEFHIYDTQNNYITKLITNEQGYASCELPYGSYWLKQYSTTPGFQMVEDIFFSVNGESEAISFSLVDEAIPVPNTNNYLYFPKGIWLYVKKRNSL